MNKIFSFNSYKAYLSYRLKLNASIRGYQGQMAKAAGCQPSYFSQVLSSSQNLTTDHAAGLCHFFSFSDLEIDYFIDLLQYEKSGSKHFKKRLQDRMHETKLKFQSLGERFKRPEQMSEKFAAYYYSNWTWSAVHMICMIPKYQKPEIISQLLHIPLQQVLHILDQLEKFRLVENKNGKWQNIRPNIHLDKKSPLRSMYYQCWRTKAVESSAHLQNTNMHFSSICCHSRHDFAFIKEMLTDCILTIKNQISHSEEEELSCLNIDFFDLLK